MSPSTEESFEESKSSDFFIAPMLFHRSQVQGPHCIQSAAPRHVGEFRDWLSGKGRPLADGLVADRAALGISKASRKGLARPRRRRICEN